MKKSVLYIVGAVALIGVGAIIFLKKKNNKDKDKLAELQNLTTNVGVGTKSSDAVTKDNAKDILESAKKIAEAKSLATQISDLRNKRNSTIAMSLNDFARQTGHLSNGFGAEAALKFYKEQEIKDLDQKIKNLDEEIGKLGYMEVNGSIAKIN